MFWPVQGIRKVCKFARGGETALGRRWYDSGRDTPQAPGPHHVADGRRPRRAAAHGGPAVPLVVAHRRGRAVAVARGHRERGPLAVPGPRLRIDPCRARTVGRDSSSAPDATSTTRRRTPARRSWWTHSSWTAPKTTTSGCDAGTWPGRACTEATWPDDLAPLRSEADGRTCSDDEDRRVAEPRGRAAARVHDRGRAAPCCSDGRAATARVEPPCEVEAPALLLVRFDMDARARPARAGTRPTAPGGVCRASSSFAIVGGASARTSSTHRQGRMSRAIARRPGRRGADLPAMGRRGAGCGRTRRRAAARGPAPASRRRTRPAGRRRLAAGRAAPRGLARRGRDSTTEQEPSRQPRHPRADGRRGGDDRGQRAQGRTARRGNRSSSWRASRTRCARRWRPSTSPRATSRTGSSTDPARVKQYGGVIRAEARRLGGDDRARSCRSPRSTRVAASARSPRWTCSALVDDVVARMRREHPAATIEVVDTTGRGGGAGRTPRAALVHPEPRRQRPEVRRHAGLGARARRSASTTPRDAQVSRRGSRPGHRQRVTCRTCSSRSIGDTLAIERRLPATASGSTSSSAASRPGRTRERPDRRHGRDGTSFALHRRAGAGCRTAASPESHP